MVYNGVQPINKIVLYLYKNVFNLNEKKKLRLDIG